MSCDRSDDAVESQSQRISKRQLLRLGPQGCNARLMVEDVINCVFNHSRSVS
jgi:hypothetical protein